jgi:hypothetical protein
MRKHAFYLQPFCGIELHSFVSGKCMTLYADSVLFHDSFLDENTKILGFKKRRLSPFEALRRVK